MKDKRTDKRILYIGMWVDEVKELLSLLKINGSMPGTQDTLERSLKRSEDSNND